MAFDPCVPIVVGGIAGMTLSMTGVKGIHELCDKAICNEAHLPEEKGIFGTMTPYRSILSYTLWLIVGFFISEILIFSSFLGYNSFFGISTELMGYIVLIITLGAMLIIYYIMLRKLPSTDPPKKLIDFEEITKYP